MIGRLSGILLEKSPPQVLVDCHGVGYEVQVSMNTFYNLPQEGQTISLWTQFIVREDAQLLYGFETQEERIAFRELVKVSGIGPRTALGILSGMSVNDLASAIATQEAGRLIKVPGIGKKTAERLLLELKGRIADALPTAAQHTQGHNSDILQALMALGYSEKEATSAVKVLPEGVGVSEGIKLALKSLG